MSNPYKDCTDVSPSCPVSATTYGYYPNLAANIIFLAIWIILFLSQSFLGYRYRTWSYSTVLALGSAMEAIGYIGRAMMHSNPWTQSAFAMQVTCLIIAPALLAAGVYLTVKHLVLHYGPEHSRLKPKLYTWIFIGCDVTSILLQAMGGGLAAGGSPDNVDIGNDIIIGGIAFQVATMVVCGVLTVDFFIRVRKAKVASSPVEEDKAEDDVTLERETTNRRGKLFLGAIIFAYFTILIRCIYRLPEMVGGWGNPRMRKETEFLMLDGLMVILATISMTVFHPGWTFPRMMTRSPA